MRPRAERIVDCREYPVLYVSGDPEPARTFELAFRHEFTVLPATGGEEALARLRETRIAAVLADARGAASESVALLERVRELDPRPLRVLVAARGDDAALRAALASGAVQQLVETPWHPDDVRSALRAGIEHYALAHERDQLLRELAVLAQAARAFARERALEPLGDLIVQTVCEELRYDAAALLLLDARGERLVWERFAPREDVVAGALRRLELTRQSAPGFLRRILDGESQLLALDAAPTLEGVVRGLVTEISAEEVLVVPLLGTRRAVGALAIDNRRGGERFGADDQTLLEGVAAQAGLALETAQLFEALRRGHGGGAGAAALDPPIPDC